MRSAWLSALGSVAASGAIALVGLATGSLAARLLGPHGRGELAAVQTIPILLAALALAGLPGALAVHCAREPARARGYLRSALGPALLLSAILGAVGYLLLPELMPHQSPTVMTAARLYLAYLPLQVLFSLPHAAVLGVGRIRSWNLVRALPPVAWLLVLVLGPALGVATGPELSRWYLVAFGLLVPVSFLVLVRSVAPDPAGPSPGQARRLLLFGAPGALATLPALLNLRLDQVLLTTLVPASELGLYVAAVAWSGGLSPIIGATAPLILPLLSGGEAQPEHRRAVAAKVMRLSVLLSVLGGLVLLATTPLALRLLFGEPFLPAMRAALILAVASAVGGLNTLSGEVLRGMGEPRWSLVAELTSLPVNLLLLWLLLPTMGILGAALASLAAYLVASAVFLVALRGSTGRGVAALYLPRRADLDGLLLLARAPR